MRYILFAAVVLVAASTAAFAQNAMSSPITAAFDVEAVIEIAATEGAFDVLAPGTEYTVAADGNIAPMTQTGAAEVAPILWEITGASGASVIVTIATPAYFEGGDDGFRVPYSVSVSSAGWSTGAFAPSDPYNPFDPRVATTIFLSGGAAAVQLGGKLSVPVGATAQTYTGNFVLTAQYTGL